MWLCLFCLFLVALKRVMGQIDLDRWIGVQVVRQWIVTLPPGCDVRPVTCATLDHTCAFYWWPTRVTVRSANKRMQQTSTNAISLTDHIFETTPAVMNNWLQVKSPTTTSTSLRRSGLTCRCSSPPFTTKASTISFRFDYSLMICGEFSVFCGCELIFALLRR